MNQEQMIEDLIKTLDSGISKGIGHMNVTVEEELPASRSVQTLGCNACARMPVSGKVSSDAGRFDSIK